MRRKNKTKATLKGVPPDDPDPDHRVRGVIPYPCCPTESVVVFADAHGRSSVKCPKCSRFAVFDYDKMCADQGRPCRGAVEQYKTTLQ